MDDVDAFGPDEEEAVAWYKFHPSARPHPYVGILSDLDGVMRDVTGEEAARVKRKVRRAYEKFKASGLSFSAVVSFDGDSWKSGNEGT
jgi:hypothetical protein